MLVVECKGTPYEIGKSHGSAAKTHVSRSISFYADLFQKNCKQSWPQVLENASSFAETTKANWPAYYEEMQGIADGAGVGLLDIVALNVRTEINFGLFSDGCTALSWKSGEKAYLGQNWDWMTAQKENLIITKIVQDGKPTIQQVTEAGIIGKIGFNSSGVGVLLNAIKVHGVNPSNLPVHFGLRMALESTSARKAVEKLKSYGMAASAHILIADKTGEAVGLEFTKSTFAECKPDELGRIVHANHLLLEHPGEVDTVWLKDSPIRVKCMTARTGQIGEGGTTPEWEEVSKVFEDEENLPSAICREEKGDSGSATLFNILMDLRQRKAVVKLGRPVQVEETVELSF